MCLVTDNIGLVYHVARRYKPPRGFEQEDIIQQGCLGLVKAARKYDADRGVKFSTLACICIESEIIKLIRGQNTKKRKTDYHALSLQDSPRDTDKITLMDMISELETVEDIVSAHEIERFAFEREPVIFIGLKYGMSQAEIGKKVGVSQVQVSRRIRKLREKMKKELAV